MQRCQLLNVQTKGRDPLANPLADPVAEKPGAPERREKQVPAETDRKVGEKPREGADKPRSLRDRLREHRLVVVIAGCLVLIALIGGAARRRYANAMAHFFQAQGSKASAAAGQAIAWIGKTLQQQVDPLAYIDVFRSLAIVGAIMIPISLTIRSMDLTAPTRRH
jgi:hypothetical protein